MFGLSFFNPTLLWGLGAAAIPILIHLYNRRRFRTVVWAAMEFLVASSKLTARRLKILQLLLLLTRMGIVSLLALGVARPFLTGGFFAGPLAKSKSSAVLILDNSYSMGLREGNATVFEVAKDAAGKVLSSFRRGDSLTLMLMGARPRVVTEGNPSPERVKSLAENAELCDETTDILASVLKGIEILESEKNTQKELFLITDCQQNGWGAGNRAGWDKVNKLLWDAKVKPRIYVLDVSGRAAENVMIQSVMLPAYPCGVGKKYMVEVTARTTVEKPEARPIFTLYLDDQGNEAARADGSEFKDSVSTGRLVFSVDSPGFHWGKVEIQTDHLEADNRRYFIVEARQSVAILCVDGVGAADRFESGIAYLSYALAPEKGMEGPDEYSNILDPKVVGVEQFWEEDLGKYEIVVLSNVGTITGRMYERLADFVGRGGGLMIFLGEDVDRLEYTERFASAVESLLPCAIGSVRGEVPSQEGKEEGEAVRIAEMDSGHPAMAAFQDRAGGDLTTAKFYRFFSVSPEASDPNVHVLARFTDGSPYILERKFGRGKTILFTSSCDAKWSNMPLKPAFLPLVHRLAYYLVSGSDERYNLTVGDKIMEFVEAEATSSPATVRTPAGATFKVVANRQPTPSPAGAQNGQGGRPGTGGPETGSETEAEGTSTEEPREPFVSFEETSRAGIYTLRTSQASEKGSESPERVRYFAVNVETKESDLSALSEEGITRLARWKELKYFKAESGVVERIEGIRHGKEIWRYFVVGVLCFLILESVLARQIDKG
jgi:uncharacterized membrane protein